MVDERNRNVFAYLRSFAAEMVMVVANFRKGGSVDGAEWGAVGGEE